MTIGVSLTFFDFRNDIRRVLMTLAEKHKVVLFVREEHAEKFRRLMTQGMELRMLRERRKTLRNYVLERRFLLFGKLPASRNNYFLCERFKLEQFRNRIVRWKAMCIWILQKFLPHGFSYDRFLQKLSWRSGTDISGIDSFLVLTEVYDDYFLARLIAERKKVHVYVYSWDHACKQTRFSRRVQYLVWNDGIAEDLAKLHGVPPGQIRVTGSSQLCFLAEFRSKDVTCWLPDAPYVYIGCATGITALAKREVECVRQIAAEIQKADPAIRVWVRPYPYQVENGVYAALSGLQNIMLDDAYLRGGFPVPEDEIYKKCKRIAGARAFLHFGSTLGLEAWFTGCPSYLVDIAPRSGKGMSLYHFVHQYQNEKYLMSDSHFVINDLSRIAALCVQPAKMKRPDANPLGSQFFPVTFARFSEQLAASLA